MDLLRGHNHEVSGFARKTQWDLPSLNADFFPDDIQTDAVSISWKALKTIGEIIYSRSAKSALQELIHVQRPDIVHAHNIYGRLTASVLDLLYNENIPVVMTLHDYKLICPSYKLMNNGKICEKCRGRFFYNAVISRCHKNSYAASTIYAFESYYNRFSGKYRKNVRYFISPSLFLKTKLVEYNWPENQIAYIPNFLLADRFEADCKPGSYFLYLGRLSEEKGVSTLIKAFKDLDHNQAKLLIAGDGPLRTQLEEQADNDRRIEFAGYLSGTKLKTVIRESLAVIIPSEWYENAPISILEAFASAKPVIASNLGGIPEMIDNAENGYLFEAGNVRSLRDKLEIMMKSPAKAIMEMGSAAREKVENEYSPQEHYKKLMSLYRRVMQE
jgi:glycosyltransferase involved in cell wall biosynthesis